jgi:mRNA deadenylase 3'-5' endonuclease subunit Ccr4
MPCCVTVSVACLQDNVALIAVLEMAPDPERSSKQLICVANTHIHANPELNDVKLWQVHTLLKGLEKIANRCGQQILEHAASGNEQQLSTLLLEEQQQTAGDGDGAVMGS